MPSDRVQVSRPFLKRLLAYLEDYNDQGEERKSAELIGDINRLVDILGLPATWKWQVRDPQSIDQRFKRM